jgi:acetyl-CoA carboxylase biotin carboxyl carrier protein
MIKVSQQDIEALLEIFDRSDWRELHVVGEGIDLFVSKDPNARRPATGLSSGISLPMVDSSRLAPSVPAPVVSTRSAAEPKADVPASWIAVRAPCLGTFYRTPKPGAPPFVSAGQRVDRDTDICLIEVMKLFTTVRAGVAGTVKQVLVADAELVEFEQLLFYIEPDA